MSDLLPAADRQLTQQHRLCGTPCVAAGGCSGPQGDAELPCCSLLERRLDLRLICVLRQLEDRECLLTRDLHGCKLQEAQYVGGPRAIPLGMNPTPQRFSPKLLLSSSSREASLHHHILSAYSDTQDTVLPGTAIRAGTALFLSAATPQPLKRSKPLQPSSDTLSPARPRAGRQQSTDPEKTPAWHRSRSPPQRTAFGGPMSTSWRGDPWRRR